MWVCCSSLYSFSASTFCIICSQASAMSFACKNSLYTFPIPYRVTETDWGCFVASLLAETCSVGTIILIFHTKNGLLRTKRSSLNLILQLPIQIPPVRVHGFNQRNLLFSRSRFYLFFPRQGITNPLKFLEPNQLINIVPAGESVFVFFVPVPFYPIFQGAGRPCVKDGVVIICGDVCKTFFGHGYEGLLVLVWASLPRHG